jgi:uncharacterized membrane protein YkoI
MLLPLAAIAFASAPAMAQQKPRDEQVAARRDADAGHILPLRRIENLILPLVGEADYIGPEFDPEAKVYRLKFLRAGRVFWVDVDARTGDVIGRSGR